MDGFRGVIRGRCGAETGCRVWGGGLPSEVKSLIPSMFHRRLLLIAGGVAIVFSPVVGQLVRLQTAQHEKSLKSAEARMVRKVATPTVRGSILDRKGRVLAQDRPAFSVLVEYSVLTGEWVEREAPRAAVKSFGTAWSGLSDEQKRRATEVFQKAYTEHWQRSWSELASRLGVPLGDVDAKRREIVGLIEKRQATHSRVVFEREMTRLKQKGSEVSAADEERARKFSLRPIAEKVQSHAVAPRVGDQEGFACQQLGEETVELRPLEAMMSEAGTDQLLATAMSQSRPVTLPRFPGLKVADSGDREYPMESVEVQVPLDSLPTPLREIGGTKTVDVSGSLNHLLGRVRDDVYGTVVEPIENEDGAPVVGPDGKPLLRVITRGDAELRKDFLAANPAIAARVLDEDGNDRGVYRDGDRVGSTGIERSMEQVLRGLRGSVSTHLDTGTRENVPAVPGEKVTLTIDAMLQARVAAAMSPELGLGKVQWWHSQHSTTQPEGTPLNGAAVVLDVETGEVLASVSTPLWKRADLADPDKAEAMYADELNAPMVNKALEKPYPPGSIVKPMILVEAMKQGRYHADERVRCNGHLYPNNTQAWRCLIYKDNGLTHTGRLGRDLDGADAVMVSCNVFFYTAGNKMGTDGIPLAYREFGIAVPWETGLASMYPGRAGLGENGAEVSTADAMQMAIGQGPADWTPLHAAHAYATVARGGVSIVPRFVRDENAVFKKGVATNLSIPADATAMALSGLWKAVNDKQGTARAMVFDEGEDRVFNCPGVKVWGKTGTATAPKMFVKAGSSERVLAEEGDHAWMVCLVGNDRPRYAIAVIMEYGGGGGKVSGPIANQIVWALVREGYLKGVGD